MEGKVQIYTGNDKGKTAAALGLAVRDLCAGRRVVIGQFVKGMTHGKLKLSNYSENSSLEQFGRNYFAYRKPTDEGYERATDDLARMEAYLKDGSTDPLIFDEVNVACGYRLIDPKGVVDLLKKGPETMEVVLAGRHAPQELVDFADLVTGMKKIKHYHKKGLKARLDIEY